MMLLAIDAGNSNIVAGVFKDDRLVCDWRLLTEVRKTADEYGMVFRNLYSAAHLRLDETEAVIIACVIPPLLGTLEEICRKYFHLSPLVVDTGTETGITILYDNPCEVGADRIVNAAAGYEKYKRSLIIIDLGTATTFDCISGRGEYLGGAIAPGIMISAEALFSRTAKLPRVELVRPHATIGKNTVVSMQSGIIFGYAELIDGMINRIKREMEEEPLVVATGGLAPLIAAESKRINRVDTHLTLEGLSIIYNKNR